MKAGWVVKPLGEVCNLVGGGTPSKRNQGFYTGDIPWATVRDMRSDLIIETEFKITEHAVRSSSTNIIPSGNVVIATRVGLGKICIIANNTAINQDLRGVIPKNNKQLFIRFLFWWLKSVSGQIVSAGKGATVQGVTLPFIKSLQIPIPPINEQQRIVAKLDEAFEAIASAKAKAEQNLLNARALFQNYLFKVFDSRKNSWERKSLGEVTQIRPQKSQVRNLLSSNDQVSFVPMEDLGINEKTFLTKQSKALSAVYSGYTYFAENDLLLAKITPCFENGKLGIARNLINKVGFGSSEYIVFRPNKNINVEWLYYYLNREVFRSEGALNMSGAVGHKRVSIGFIESYLIPIPPIDEQRELIHKMDSISEQTQQLESLYQQKINALDELKYSLLHQAFSGEL